MRTTRVLVLSGALFISACSRMPKPTQVAAPVPIADNSGPFLSPYTSDGTVAPWVVKGRNAKLGGAVGAYTGSKAGEAALGAVPLVGGWLGGKAGKKAGREIALALVGGTDAMKQSSDMSFKTADEMIVYLYAKHYNPKDKDWRETYDLTKEIYPDLKDRWEKAIKKAPRKRS